MDLIGGATSNIVGGSRQMTANVISGNSDNGVLITDPGTAYNEVQGDYIGTDSTGAIAVPNCNRGLDPERGLVQRHRRFSRRLSQRHLGERPVRRDHH